MTHTHPFKQFLFAIFLICTFSGANAQTYIDGTWSGSLTQYPTGLSSTYDFQLTLISHGDSLSGTSTIILREAPENFGTMDFQATWDGIFLEINEETILEEEIFKFGYWCLKDLFLTLDETNGIDILEGEWYSNNCKRSSGEIYLERVTL